MMPCNYFSTKLSLILCLTFVMLCIVLHESCCAKMNLVCSWVELEYFAVCDILLWSAVPGINGFIIAFILLKKTSPMLTAGSGTWRESIPTAEAVLSNSFSINQSEAASCRAYAIKPAILCSIVTGRSLSYPSCHAV